MGKIWLISIALCCGILQSYGQGGYEDGFIIKNDGDTLRGEVKFQTGAKRYQHCQFKLGDNVTTYSPSQINGYAVTGYKLFISGVEPGRFVESLVEGKLSLYKSPNSYIVRKDEELHTLIPPTEQNASTQNREYLHTMAYLISDCAEDWEVELKSLKHNETDLTRLVTKYNTCTGTSPVIYKKDQPWAKAKVGILAGMIQTEIEPFIRYIQYDHLERSYTSSDPFFGIFVDFSAPQFSRRVSMQVEAHIFQSEYEGYKEDPFLSQIETHATSMEYTILSLPISLKYIVPFGTNSLFLQAGGNFDFFINSDSERTTQVIRRNNNEVVTTIEGPAFESKSSSFGMWVGFGYSKQLGGIRTGICARYHRLYNMAEEDQGGEFIVATKGNRMSLSIFLQKD